MNQDEIWKPLFGYEGLYIINQFGTIKSLERIVIRKNGWPQTIHSRIIKPHLNEKGYLIVNLKNKGVNRCQRVHRLLMQTFVPNPDNKPFIDHINTIKTDNRLENLRWVTAKENTNNPITLNRLKECSSNADIKAKAFSSFKKSNSKCSPITVYQYTIDYKYVTSYESITKAAKSISINYSGPRSRIALTLNNRNATAYGFRWFSFPLNS